MFVVDNESPFAAVIDPISINDKLVLESASRDIAADCEVDLARAVDFFVHFLMVLPSVPLTDQLHRAGDVLLRWWVVDEIRNLV